MMSGADVAGFPATERSRVLLVPVRLMVANLAILVSFGLLSGQFGFQHYLRAAFSAALRVDLVTRPLLLWRSRTRDGVFDVPSFAVFS